MPPESNLPAAPEQGGELILPQADARAYILDIQRQVGEMPQIDCPVQHHFAPGQYAREILLPAGSIVVGKIHKHAHINVISKGRVSVYTEQGVKLMRAPFTFVSEPGTKRVVFAHDDVIWTTIHVTNSTDLAEIERELIATDYVALDCEIAQVLEHAGEIQAGEPALLT